MRQFELAALAPGTAWPDIQHIAPSRGTGSAGFAGLMQQVREEITDFIAHGSQDFSAMSAGLSPEARARFLTSQTVAGADEPQGLNAQQQDFLSGIEPHAREAARRLGVSPSVLAAHAALESGWGKQPLLHGDGRDTHNLFGIKAGSGWQGDFAAVPTTEYDEGVATRKTERFRSYADYDAAFGDFARLLIDKPRYHGALNTGNDARAYAQALARGGYATDPDYADKLVQVAARIQSAR